MSKFSTIQATLQLAVGTALLALMLRTWLVMGLVEPVVVAGSSMAPTLFGSHVEVECPHCESTFSAGTEFTAEMPHVDCPRCSQRHIPLTGMVMHPGDRLWIDRTAFERRQPRRGEVVVLRNPHDASQLCVKRVVGLPGETVELSSGDVWIDGQPWRKTLHQQRAVRQLMHRESTHTQSWHPDDTTDWQWSGAAWNINAAQASQRQWLWYEHADGQPITDDVPYNVGLSRELNLVRDLAVSAKLQARGRGEIVFDFLAGGPTLRAEIALPAGKVSLIADGRLLHTTVLSAESRRRLARGAVLLELSDFDRQFLLAIDSQVEVRYHLVDVTPAEQPERPLAWGASGLQVELSKLTVYRDIHHTRQPLNQVDPSQPAALQLGGEQYYLLGDNSPVSLDSRIWGGVSARMLLGRPLGVR